jgi:poly(A) polymerase
MNSLNNSSLSGEDSSIFKISLPPDMLEAVREIAVSVSGQGFELCIVGGAVRDIVSGKTPHDVDMVTTATPEELAEIFPDIKLSGASFGVMRLRRNGFEFEIASGRKERNYLDGRHPENIQYTRDLDEDAERRDFTINAMRLDPLTGRLFDPAGGLQDLARGILRTVGEPEQRFKEDYLRMLRAIRFAARCNFEIEENTWNAIKKLSSLASELAGERIYDELTRILTGRFPHRAICLMAECGLLRAVLPEVDAMRGVTQPPEFHPEGDVFEHTLLMLEHMVFPDTLLAWSVLLHDVGKPLTRSVEESGRIRFFCHEEKGAQLVSNIAERLHFSVRDKEAVSGAVRNHMRMAYVPEMKKAKLKKIMASEHFALEAELNRLDCLCSNKIMTSFLFFCDELRKDPEQKLLHLPEPWVMGRELIAAGFKPSPLFKKVLDDTFDRQLADEFENKEAALLWAVNAMKNS